jgi:putative tryptophan/tyrosine transport system substrate-binding protein
VEFFTIVGGAAAAWPFGARAQQSAGAKRLGVLMSVRENDPEGKAQLSGFMEALAALGWIVDRNLWMEIRWGGGDVSRTRTFAKELVALQPDVILTQGTPGTAALQPETRTIPIVFVVVADPVGPGFVTSLSRPGGNITGFINSEAAMGAKMLELLTEIAPGIKRVAMIFNPDTAPGRGTYYYRDFEAAARSVQLEPIEARARSAAEIEAVVTSLGGEPRGGLVVTPDYFMLNHSQQIVSQAARNNVPTIYPWRSVVSKQDG